MASFYDWLLGAVSSGLTAYGEAKQESDAQKAAEARNAALASTDYWNQQQLNTARAQGVLAADPLGAAQRYAQRNALFSAILKNLGAPRSVPADPGVAAAMGTATRKLLPEGGFANMAPFSPNAIQAAIVQRQRGLMNLYPRAPQVDLNSLVTRRSLTPSSSAPHRKRRRRQTRRHETAIASEWRTS